MIYYYTEEISMEFTPTVIFISVAVPHVTLVGFVILREEENSIELKFEIEVMHNYFCNLASV